MPATISDPIKIKRGDTRPEVRVLIGYAGGAANSAGLADATTVLFRLAHEDTAALKFEAEASIVDEDTGEVLYQWDADANDTDEIGKYRGEFLVTYVDGRTETFPTDGGIAIEITPRVDDEAGRGC